MKLLLIKTPKGWAPGNMAAQEEHERQKIGQYSHGNFRKVRDPIKHRKFFLLLSIAFDWWEPGELDSKYGKPGKNFDQFRADVTILAGYYETVVRLNGDVRIVPKSISFAKMDNDEFEELYSRVIDVIIQRIIPNSSREDIDNMVLEAMKFA